MLIEKGFSKVKAKKREKKNGPVIVKRGDTTIVVPQSMINFTGELKIRARKMINKPNEEDIA